MRPIIKKNSHVNDNEHGNNTQIVRSGGILKHLKVDLITDATGKNHAKDTSKTFTKIFGVQQQVVIIF